MRKFLIIVLAMVLIVTNGLLVGCVPKVGELQDLEVELHSVTPIFAGMESICFTPIWTIENPNDFPVTVEMFSYKLFAEWMPVIGREGLKDIYIPANTEIEVKDVCVVEIAGLNGPIVALAFVGDPNDIKARAAESGVPGIIAIVDQTLAMVDQLAELSKALGGASMAAEAVAKGKDAGAAAELRAISDKLSATLNSPKMAKMLGPGAGDKLTAAADHAEAGMTAALEEDVEILKGLAGGAKKMVTKLVTGPACVAAAMPTWKTLGGKLPSTLYTLLAPNDLKDAWDTIPAKAPTFKSEGTISIDSAAGKKEMSFSGLTWTG